MSDIDTIYALSSGQPPAAIGIIRISGIEAGAALRSLMGKLPAPRIAKLSKIIDPESGELLDEALCLWFPGPHSATGEDLAEIHCHGGRAVVRAIERSLEKMDSLRGAEPGEFTRRAFANGQMDLAEAEGLSDLLFAETELQRKAAVRAAGGGLSRKIDEWQDGILKLSALVEAELDFSDEDDVMPVQLENIKTGATALAESLNDMLRRPRTEKLRDGIRVVLGGPPNSGKSTLLNALVNREAAIVSDIAGTTRDVIEIPVALEGVPFLFVDTAGIRDRNADTIEKIGIERARQQFDLADIMIWLGPEGEVNGHPNLIEVASRLDMPNHVEKSEGSIAVSPVTGDGMSELIRSLLSATKTIIPSADEITVNKRQASHLQDANSHLSQIAAATDYLIIGEYLRLARRSLDAITGRASTEDMLDALFGKFCIGK